MTRGLRMGAALLLALPAIAAAPLAPADFSWSAPLELPADARWGRVALPGEALVRLRSPAQGDLRVFDADGRPAAFARVPGSAASGPPELTPSYPAWPLVQAASAPPGGVQVRVEGGAGPQAVWVQVDGSPPTPGQVRLPAALFDTRGEKRPIDALVLQAELPPNTPVRLQASTSPDLAQWTPIPLRGSLYRFDHGGPANDTLRLERPVSLADRYLRLEWDAQIAVTLAALQARRASTTAAPRPVAELGEPRVVDGGLEWRIDTTAPIAALVPEPTRADAVLPLRVLGRADPAQPWRQLAQALAFRHGEGAQAHRSAPVPVALRGMRWLRLEPLPGHAWDPTLLRLRVELEPLELAFNASGPRPLRVAAGRPDTSSAQVDAGLLSAATELPMAQWPQAQLGPAHLQAPRTATWDRLVPAGVSPQMMLWTLLVAGALLLGVLAWRLVRMLKP
ncbi:DUF3999 family protein [Ramlibacter sp. AW1]|uniref:DUF3999 family protein n=1 Tax=Ramlibacter aurantiacus TaxID=2801330 RepID=A0A937D7E9_9BURK|nr:DUF3999 family protein [Ramlibacter aurantiacus]MBL0420861.1 DUF3999 family protein [Ramlibacter aurantiacus]